MFKNRVFDIFHKDLIFAQKSLINLREDLDLNNFDCFNFQQLEVEDFGYSYRGEIKIYKLISKKTILKELEAIERYDSLLKIQKKGIEKVDSPSLKEVKASEIKGNRKNKEKRGLKLIKAVFVSSLIFIFGILGFKGYKLLRAKDFVLNKSSLAYQNLASAQNALSQFNFVFADQKFLKAFKNFSEIKKKLDDLNTIFFKFFGVDKKLESAKNLVSAARYLSLTGKEITNLIDKLLILVNNTLDIDSQNFFDFSSYKKNLIKINFLLNNAEGSLKRVNEEVLPEEIKNKVIVFKNEFPFIKEFIMRLNNSTDFLYNFLGFNGEKNYFLVFQNNAEIRATGGFWGSYGILKLKNGKMIDLLIDDIYNPDGQLKEKIIPPQPLQRITKYWGLRDANWFFDFPLSAKKAVDFYKKVNKNSDFDGIIAITPRILQELLEITGPIELSNHKAIINSDNFFDLIQYKVESDYINPQNRKQILTDLAPLIIKKLNNSTSINSLDSLEKIFSIIFEGLREKDILLYFFDNNLQKFIKDNNWSGRVFDNSKDYLALVHSNIGGWKTDRIIKNKIKISVEIEDDGSIINTLEIKRSHLGGDSAYFWFNKINKDYLRVFVPLGSKLLDIEGEYLNIDNKKNIYSKDVKVDSDLMLIESTKKEIKNADIFFEANKTVFGFWLYTKPGETSRAILKYKLPFKLNINKDSADFYSLLIQKQPGIDSDFYFEVRFPLRWKLDRTYPSNLDLNSDILNFKNVLTFKNSLNTDKYIAVKFKF